MKKIFILNFSSKNLLNPTLFFSNLSFLLTDNKFQFVFISISILLFVNMIQNSFFYLRGASEYKTPRTKKTSTDHFLVFWNVLLSLTKLIWKGFSLSA